MTSQTDIVELDLYVPPPPPHPELDFGKQFKYVINNEQSNVLIKNLRLIIRIFPTKWGYVHIHPVDFVSIEDNGGNFKDSKHFYKIPSSYRRRPTCKSEKNTFCIQLYDEDIYLSGDSFHELVISGNFSDLDDIYECYDEKLCGSDDEDEYDEVRIESAKLTFTKEYIL